MTYLDKCFQILLSLPEEAAAALRKDGAGQPGWSVWRCQDGERLCRLGEGPEESAVARWLPADTATILEACDRVAQVRWAVRGRRILTCWDGGATAQLLGRYVRNDQLARWHGTGQTPQIAALRLLHRLQHLSFCDYVADIHTKACLSWMPKSPNTIRMSMAEWRELLEEQGDENDRHVSPRIHRTFQGLHVVWQEAEDSITVTYEERSE